VTNNIGAVSGGSLVIGGVISARRRHQRGPGRHGDAHQRQHLHGGTSINGGTLTLDYTGAATSIIPSTSSLTWAAAR